MARKRGDKDLVLVRCCAQEDVGDAVAMEGLELLQKMKVMGVAPDIISFNTLISACSYSASNPQPG